MHRIAALALVVGCVGCSAKSGPAETAGDLEPQGVDGAAGAQGPKGEQGPVGAIGPAGTPGQPGPQGSAGAQGVQGVAGAQGAVGPQGPAGNVGLTGTRGPAGPSLVIRDANGAARGFLFGMDAWNTDAGCFMRFQGGFSTYGAVKVYWTNPDCTGTPYSGGSLYSNPLVEKVLPAYCVTGYSRGLAPLTWVFRAASPSVTENVRIYSVGDSSQYGSDQCKIVQGVDMTLQRLEQLTEQVAYLVEPSSFRLE